MGFVYCTQTDDGSVGDTVLLLYAVTYSIYSI